MSNDRDDIDKFIEGARKILDLVEENKDTVERFVPSSEGGKELRIDELEPLTEIHMDENLVIVEIESNIPNPGEMNVSRTEEGAVFGFGDELYQAHLPDDAVLKDLDAEYNNGVLKVEVPREKTKGVSVKMEMDEEMEKVDRGKENEGVEEKNDGSKNDSGGEE